MTLLLVTNSVEFLPRTQCVCVRIRELALLCIRKQLLALRMHRWFFREAQHFFFLVEALGGVRMMMQNTFCTAMRNISVAETGTFAKTARYPAWLTERFWKLSSLFSDTSQKPPSTAEKKKLSFNGKAIRRFRHQLMSSGANVKKMLGVS